MKTIQEMNRGNTSNDMEKLVLKQMQIVNKKGGNGVNLEAFLDAARKMDEMENIYSGTTSVKFEMLIKKIAEDEINNNQADSDWG